MSDGLAAAASTEFVLANCTIVDGTGAKAYPGNITVRDGRITAVGRTPVGDEHLPRIDVAHQVIAPGFIDIHTHYDAQVLWDPDLTPSSWHGVTTVVMGNCGFSIAPVKPALRNVIVETLEYVEDMEPAALNEGIDWSFERFDEYLTVLRDRPKRLNVAAMIGHTALRLYAMDLDGIEREATPAEVDQMAAIVTSAIDAGAVGFATSRSPSHIGYGARPVASRAAALSEVQRIVEAVDRTGRGIIQMAAGLGLDEVASLASRTSRPIIWGALLTGRYHPKTALEMVDASSALGDHVWPQISCRPLTLQITLQEPRGFASLPAFADALALPTNKRAELYRDATWRSRAASETLQRWGSRWGSVTIDSSPSNPDYEGVRLADLWDVPPDRIFDNLVDLSLQDDLKTRFVITVMNDDEDELAALLQDPRTLLGLSDAGAHASQLCDACYSTHLLGYWVRDRKALSLEQAVWRLSGQPAELLGLSDRGLIREGNAADLVLFDPTTVAPGTRSRVRDLPGGCERIIVRSEGIHAVWVNGQLSLWNGEHHGSPGAGEVLRGA